MSKSVNVKFSESYVGCRILGNIMGLHEETVRKRAKAGKIPGKIVDGRWTFQHVELVRAMIHPFASVSPTIGNSPPAPVIPLPVRETDVIFVLDRSGSMSSLMPQARQNLRDQLNALAKAVSPQDLYTVSIIAFDSSIEHTASVMDPRFWNVSDLTRLYPGARHQTALTDAVMEAIAVERRRDAQGGQKAFLISIVTDGDENASSVSIDRLRDAVVASKTAGRFTFTFAGPNNFRANNYALSIGIDPGNITQWEQTTAGLADLNVRTESALTGYARSRSLGATQVNSFYAQPVVANPQDFAKKLGSELQKMDPQAITVARVMPDDPIVIREFAGKKVPGGFRKGKVFYQLTESEKVQEYKGIIIQDVATGAFYSGWEAAARLLGIPKFSGTVHIRPGQLGEFKVFIQSTSVNRKLVPGTVVVALN